MTKRCHTVTLPPLQGFGCRRGPKFVRMKPLVLWSGLMRATVGPVVRAMLAIVEVTTEFVIRVSISWSPALRHAFVTSDAWSAAFVRKTGAHSVWSNADPVVAMG